MHELISLSQANHIMIAILIVAPVIGAIWGVITKELLRGLVYGVVIGAGNYILWNVYNAITDNLGLDTVKNLLVNLGLFIVVGVVAGLVVARINNKPLPDNKNDSTESKI
jgi:hypothetical protein